MASTIDDLRSALIDASVADDVEPMTAYTKHRFVYLGVKAPARRDASKALIAASRRAPIDDAVAVARELRGQREREFHYVASDLLRANDRRLRPGHLADLRAFITTDAWWDTVDALASPTVGTMVLQYPELGDEMDIWIDEEDIWLARSAIIHQLRFGDRTDEERLFRYALRRAGDREFFIRKAIGWSLRQYARTDPAAVRSFVDAHVETLSPLSVREALKNL